jgi:putative phosphoesterase
VLIGILSDTHEHAEITAASVALLRARGAQFFIHCGDVGSEQVLDQLAGLPCAFVFGNCDWDRDQLERYAANIGVACHGVFADLELGGKRFAVLHGDDSHLRERLLIAQGHDYLLQGHTHVRLDDRVGRTRIINPGALFRAREKTVALLDTATDQLEFLVVASKV